MRCMETPAASVTETAAAKNANQRTYRPISYVQRISTPHDVRLNDRSR
ncbi:hypothetical protein OKW49_003754 [Paraburkholderia youngii]